MNIIDREKAKEKAENFRIEIITSIVGVIENNLARTKILKDPITRHIVFLEKLLTISDILLGISNGYTDNVPPELKNRIDRLVDSFNSQIIGLLDWIQQPVYSPDHPIGSSLMQECKDNFAKLS